MKINNRGMTLVELIISIALISLVISFLYKVVLDVKYEKDNQGFASNNQINRAEIIKTIQEDFLESEIRDMPDSAKYLENGEILYTIYCDDGKTSSITISADKKTLSYKQSSNTRKWTIEDVGYTYSDIIVERIQDSYVKVTIPVESSFSDQTIDDIELLAKLS